MSLDDLEQEKEEVNPTENTESDNAEPSDDPQKGETEGEAEQQTDEEVVLTVGDEEVKLTGENENEADNTPLVKHLRTTLRETQKQLQELKRSQQAIEPTPTARIVDLQAEMRKKFPNGEPEEVDFDFNPVAYRQAVKEFALLEKAIQDESKAAQRQAEEERSNYQQQFTAKAEQYLQGKQKAKQEGIRNFEELEGIVEQNLTRPQQEILLLVADNPALVVPLIASNRELLEKISKTTDPLLLAAEIGRLEGRKIAVKRQQVASKPQAETVLKGSGAASREYELQKAREMAEKTGDFRAYHKLHKQINVKR